MRVSKRIKGLMLALVLILLMYSVSACTGERTYTFSDSGSDFFEVFASGGGCTEAGGLFTCQVNSGSGVTKYAKAVGQYPIYSTINPAEFNFTFEMQGDTGQYGWWAYSGLCRATTTDCDSEDTRPWYAIEGSHNNVGSFWCHASETEFPWPASDSQYCFNFLKTSLGGLMSAYYSADCDGDYTLIGTCSLPDDNNEDLRPVLSMRKNDAQSGSYEVSWDNYFANSSNYLKVNYQVLDLQDVALNSDCLIEHISSGTGSPPYWDDSTLTIPSGIGISNVTKLYPSCFYREDYEGYVESLTYRVTCDEYDINELRYATLVANTDETTITSYFDVTLGESKTVHVYATYDFGSPINGLTVSFINDVNEKSSCITNSTGECDIELADGNYAVWSYKLGSYDNTRSPSNLYVYEQDQNYRITRESINLPYEFNVKVIDTDGSALEDASVGIFSCPNNNGDDFFYYADNPTSCMFLGADNTNSTGDVNINYIRLETLEGDSDILIVARHPTINTGDPNKDYAHEMVYLDTYGRIITKVLYFPPTLNYEYCFKFIDKITLEVIPNSVYYSVYDNDLGKVVSSNSTTDMGYNCFTNYFDSHSYTVSANHENYSMTSEDIIFSIETGFKDFYMNPDSSIIEDDYKFNIMGYAYDLDTNDTLNNLKLCVVCSDGYRETEYTNDTGYYVFSDIINDVNCDIDTGDTGYINNPRSFSLHANKTQELVFREKSDNILTFTIRTVDKTTNLGSTININNAKITLSSSGIDTIVCNTDSAGLCIFSDITGNLIYNVKAEHNNYELYESTLTPNNYGTLDLILVPKNAYSCFVNGYSYLKNGSESARTPIDTTIRMYDKEKDELLYSMNTLVGKYTFSCACDTPYTFEAVYYTGSNVLTEEIVLRTRNIAGDSVTHDFIFEVYDSERQEKQQGMIDWIYEQWELIKLLVLLIIIAFVVITIKSYNSDGGKVIKIG